MSETKNILLIDDNEFVHHMVDHALADKSFNLISAFDGHDGINKLNTHPVDLIFLDINMPGQNGFEVCKKIKAGPHAHVPIVFMTEYGKPKNAIKAMALGASDFVHKPFNAIELIIRIATQFRLQRYKEDYKNTNGGDGLSEKVLEAADELHNPIAIIDHSLRQLKRSTDDDSRKVHIANLEASFELIKDSLNKLKSVYSED